MSDIDQAVENALQRFAADGGSLTDLASSFAGIASQGRGHGFSAIGGAATAFAVLALTEQANRIADALEKIAVHADNEEIRTRRKETT